MCCIAAAAHTYTQTHTDGILESCLKTRNEKSSSGKKKSDKYNTRDERERETHTGEKVEKRKMGKGGVMADNDVYEIKGDKVVCGARRIWPRNAR